MAIYGSILCATDFSQASLAALTEALRLAEEGGARLTVLHVIHETALEGDEEMESFLEELQAKAEERFVEVVPDGVRERLSVECVIARGGPVREVIRAAVQGKHDLVVIGTHGAGGSSERGPGSTGQGILILCPVPVLVVKPGGFATESARPQGAGE